jgi:23S rRNA (adenine2030-N6)-methyltransferase
MNYRHGFHAGNFADVFKHALFARLLVYLARKEAPFRIIDTHAGEGVYDLASEEAERTLEWRDGIGRLADMGGAEDEARALLQPYLDSVGRFGPDGRPELYPGSPAIAARLMRPQDRAIFCELRPDAYEALRRRFSRDERIKAIHIDGYVGLGAFVPPRERRGLVLVDPPFERTDELEAMFSAFLAAYEKWPTGVYALWRPTKDAAADRKFLQAFERRGVKRALSLLLDIGAAAGLRRTGLVVVNPPFVFEDEARAILGFLVSRLQRGEGAAFAVERLTDE